MSEPKAVKNESLFDKGTLVSLTVSRWSGQKSLTKEDMSSMGVNTENLPKKLTTPGKKFLIPRSYLKSVLDIEAQARRYLAANSKPFFIGGLAFVPNNKLADLELQLAKFQSSFEKAVDIFINKFEQFKKEIANEHPDFWERCLKQKYPINPQSLKEKFAFKFSTFKIASLGDENREQMQKEVQNFVGEYVGTMRQQVAEFCEKAKNKLLGKEVDDEGQPKKLTKKSLNSFRKYITDFQSLNVFGDVEVESLLNNFRKEFITDLVEPEYFEDGKVKSMVSKSLEAIKNKALSDESSSKFIDGLKRKITL